MTRVRSDALLVTAVYPYSDSVDIFFRGRGNREANQALYAAIRRWGAVYDCFDRRRRWCGYRLVIQLPEPAMLPALDRVRQQWGGVICRLDVALDLQSEQP